MAWDFCHKLSYAYYAQLHIYVLRLEGPRPSIPPPNDQITFGHIFIGENWVAYDALLHMRGCVNPLLVQLWSINCPAAAASARKSGTLLCCPWSQNCGGIQIYAARQLDCLWVPSRVLSHAVVRQMAVHMVRYGKFSNIVSIIAYHLVHYGLWLQVWCLVWLGMV